jgi:Effector-associated domain 11
MAASWKLIAETRKKCIWAALTGTALCVLLVFVQSVSGMLEGILAAGWGWILLVVLPALVVLWASILLNRYPAKIVHPGAHQVLVWGSWTYFLLALCTLLAEPFALQGERSLQQYLSESLWWMVPLEGILIAGYWLVFYRKDLIFKPDEQVILELAAKKADGLSGENQLARKQCYALIAAGDMAGAFTHIRTILERQGGADLAAVVILEGQYHNLVRERDLAVLERDKAQIALNKIAMGVINMANKL